MDEFSRLGSVIPNGAIEVSQARNLTSKTFALPDGQWEFQTSGQLIHYEENGQLLDVNLEPDDEGDYWEINKAPYILRVWKNSPKTYFLDKASGYEVTMDTGLKSECVSQVFDRGHEFIFSGLFDGTLSIIATADSMLTENLVNSGIYSIEWIISQNQPDPKILETNIRAVDVKGRVAEVIVERSPLTQSDKAWMGTFKETFTGNVLITDKKTRVKSVGVVAAYPVTIIT